MNVTLPKKEKGTKRRIILYVIILIICIFSVIFATYQFFLEEKLDVIVGMTKTENSELKEEFFDLFKNNLITNTSNATVIKMDKEKEIVYTQYEKKEKSSNNYDIDVNIPIINIDNNLAKRYNEEIKQTFQVKAENIMQTQNSNTAYSVNYMASIDNNILSVVIYATLKEGNSPQRIIVKTYNYNLNTNTVVTLNDLMQIKNIEKNTVQNKIIEVVKNEQEQTEKLRDMGYNVFSRNIEDKMYNIDNTSEFFMYNNNLYIVYAYGNSYNTSEMDLIIL